MTTTGDAIKGAINTNWSVVTGGTKPTLTSTEDVTDLIEDTLDRIWFLEWTENELKPSPVNDKYENITTLYNIRVATGDTVSATKRADRLKEMVDEVHRIIYADGVTGYTEVRFGGKDYFKTDKRRHYYACDVIIDLTKQLVEGAITPGSHAVSDWTIDTLHVTTSIDGNPTAALSDVTAHTYKFAVGVATYDTQMRYFELAIDNASDRDFSFKNAGAGNLNAIFDGTIGDGTDDITPAHLADLLMFGSANADYVPCVPFFYNFTSWDAAGGPSIFRNTGADDVSIGLILPMPTTKGSLKLYITHVQLEIADADDGDEVTRVKLYIVRDDDSTLVVNDGTAREAPGTYEYGPYNQDCSAHTSVVLYIDTECTNALDLEIQSVSVKCYYAA